MPYNNNKHKNKNKMTQQNELMSICRPTMHGNEDVNDTVAEVLLDRE